jgi:hypothetical protein
MAKYEGNEYLPRGTREIFLDWKQDSYCIV